MVRYFLDEGYRLHINETSHIKMPYDQSWEIPYKYIHFSALFLKIIIFI